MDSSAFRFLSGSAVRTSSETRRGIPSASIGCSRSGDWLAPKGSPHEDEIFVEKPPLKFWIVAAPIRLGLLPHDEFGLRFWDAFFGAIAFLYVFAIGLMLAGPVCGLLAVLILFSHDSLLFDHGIRGNNMEAALLLCYCGGMYHFLRWVRLKPDPTTEGSAVRLKPEPTIEGSPDRTSKASPDVRRKDRWT